jgi:hypothetical protein
VDGGDADCTALAAVTDKTKGLRQSLSEAFVFVKIATSADYADFTDNKNNRSA